MNDISLPIYIGELAEQIARYFKIIKYKDTVFIQVRNDLIVTLRSEELYTKSIRVTWGSSHIQRAIPNYQLEHVSAESTIARHIQSALQLLLTDYEHEQEQEFD